MQSLEQEIISAPAVTPPQSLVDNSADKPIKPLKTALKVELLEEAFANAYVRFGFNGTRAMKSIRGDITEESAAQASSVNLKKQNVVRRIMELLPKQSKARAVIYEALHAERPKNISWRDLHKYVITDLELNGELKQAIASTNIGIIIEDNG